MTTTTRERAMRVAERRVEGFAKHYGEAHRNLARHAAFPLVLTPDLLYQIWANFVPEAAWTAVAHVLLSRLCRQVGYEMYEMDIADRNLLLRELKEQFGQQRLDELGEFLLDYVAQRLTEDDPDTQDLAEAQEWTALAYTRPDEAVHKLAEAFSLRVKQKNMTDVLRLASLVETFAEPLKEGGFEPLLVYADEMVTFARGDLEGATAKLGNLPLRRRLVQIAGFSLPIPEQVSTESSQASKVFPNHRMAISSDSIQQLLPLLRPLMEYQKDRRGYLIRALGMNTPVLHRLDWDIPVDAFITSMVKELIDFGNIAPGKPALCALLEEICNNVGVDNQARIDRLLQQIQAELTETSVEHEQVQSEREVQNMQCAVILTAIPVEYIAVRAHLTELQEEEHPDGTIYERGVFGQYWQVGIVEIGAGNADAAVETKRAIDYFKPSVLLFVGIAGGIKDVVALGDVVAATKVYGYESGKVIEETFLPRPNVSLVSYALEQRAKAEARKEDWLKRIKEPILKTKPRAFTGAIAAGDKVVASTNSDIYKLLRSNYGDALAVEMESHGFLKAVRANPEINTLIIRGISDLIDGKSNADAAGSQETAAHHASAFAFEILAKLNVNPGTVQTTDDLPQTVDALIKQVEKLLSDSKNYIALEKLVVREAKALAEVIQGEHEACPWVLHPNNQTQCQQCLDYLEAKSERFVRILATVIYYGQKEEFIELIAKAFRIIVKPPSPPSFNDPGIYIRLYPLALAIYAVFIVGVQKQSQKLLRAILDIQFTWSVPPDRKIVKSLVCLFSYADQVLKTALGQNNKISVTVRIKNTLSTWLDGLIEEVDSDFWKGEFVLSLAYIESDGRFYWPALYLVERKANYELKNFLREQPLWLMEVYQNLEDMLQIFDAQAERAASSISLFGGGFRGGAISALREEIQY